MAEEKPLFEVSVWSEHLRYHYPFATRVTRSDKTGLLTVYSTEGRKATFRVWDRYEIGPVIGASVPPAWLEGVPNG